jgi:hypothetical protein
LSSEYADNSSTTPKVSETAISNDSASASPVNTNNPEDKTVIYGSVNAMDNEIIEEQ